GVPRLERSHEVHRAASLLGVDDCLGRTLGSLSTGQARRLLLAAAVLGGSDVLLLDEPTLGLDPAARVDLRRTLTELRKMGTTILLSTHLLEDVEELCERVVCLRSGRVVGDEAVGEEPSPARELGPRSVRLGFVDDAAP